MSLDPIHSFYCSKAWNDLAKRVKVQSCGVCSDCGKIFDISELRAHHIVELTLDNISDVNITLNENNVEVLCHDCHNKRHNRFLSATDRDKHVYVVHGAPFSGKTTYVETVATRNDLIVDLDKLHRAICVCGLRDKPDATKKLSFRLRDMLLDEIRTASSRRHWQDAYIIGMYPEKFDRDYMVSEYGAELIHISTSLEECIQRVRSKIPEQAAQEMYIGWITSYFKRYSD